MNRNKKTKNNKVNKAISNMGNSNSIAALNASTSNTPTALDLTSNTKNK